MKPMKDYSGRRFGELEVLRTEENPDRPLARHYRCICHSCGTSLLMSQKQLTRWVRPDCGCGKKTVTIGERRGELTVIGRAEDHVDRSGQKTARWQVLCERCGNVEIWSGKRWRWPGEKSCCRTCAAQQKKEELAEASRSAAEMLRPKPPTEEWRSEPREGLSITEVELLARRAGLTYGKYVAGERSEGTGSTQHSGNKGTGNKGTGNREQGTGTVGAQGRTFRRCAARPKAFPFREFERPGNSPVDIFQRDGARSCAMGPNASALGARVRQARGRWHGEAVTDEVTSPGNAPLPSIPLASPV